MAIKVSEFTDAFSEGRKRRRESQTSALEALAKQAELAELGYEVTPQRGRFGGLFGGGGYELKRGAGFGQAPKGFTRVGGKYEKIHGYLSPLEEEEKQASIEASKALAQQRRRPPGTVSLKSAYEILSQEPGNVPGTGFFGIGAKKGFSPEQEAVRKSALSQVKRFGGYGELDTEKSDDELIEEYQTTNDPERIEELELILANKGYQIQ